MNKATTAPMIAVVICFMGNPGRQYPAKLHDLGFEEVATAISQLSMPSIAS